MARIRCVSCCFLRVLGAIIQVSGPFRRWEIVLASFPPMSTQSQFCRDEIVRGPGCGVGCGSIVQGVTFLAFVTRLAIRSRGVLTDAKSVYQNPEVGSPLGRRFRPRAALRSALGYFFSRPFGAFGTGATFFSVSRPEMHIIWSGSSLAILNCDGTLLK